jgi:DNA-binding LytR/AlgR family response regulator
MESANREVKVGKKILDTYLTYGFWRIDALFAPVNKGKLHSIFSQRYLKDKEVIVCQIFITMCSEKAVYIIYYDPSRKLISFQKEPKIQNVVVDNNRNIEPDTLAAAKKECNDFLEKNGMIYDQTLGIKISTRIDDKKQVPSVKIGNIYYFI